MTMEKTELNTSVNEELQDEYVSEHISVIDFKMITFSLAEKDYAIDIMKVKEIAKANNFTYVPNTAPFVLGVYNLRGDIIPIIDLRIFFNIPIKQRAKDTIERAVKKGTGELEGVEYIEIRYEGYGPGGVAFLVDVVTDNKNRSASTVRMNFSRNEGNLGETGSVAFMFDRKGILEFDKKKVNEDKLMETALEAGAEDIIDREHFSVVITDPNDFENVKKALDGKGLNSENAEITMYPQNEIEITDIETATKILKLYDDLEDNEDVQEIYANFNISDEILEKMEG